jgi:ribosome-associated heat shock protein Hsp15
LRIDVFLHRIRLVKSRSLAQALVAQGTTRIEGKRVGKPSDPVRVGAIIALPMRGRVRVIRVLALPDRRGPPAEARAAYAEIDEASAAT